MSPPPTSRADIAAGKEAGDIIMSRRSRQIIGLALSERGIALAQVRVRRHGPEVVRTSTLALPLPLENPTESGEALARHLREQGYTTRRVIVGLSASRLLARHKLIPEPPDDQSLRDMLRLTLERDFAGGGRDLCVDYWKQTTDDARANVLMIATAHEVRERIERMCAAAQLQLHAITPTLLAIADESETSLDRSLLVVSDDGAELLLGGQRGPVGLAHVSGPDHAADARDTADTAAESGPSSEALAEAVMRALVSGAPTATHSGDSAPQVDVVCDPAMEETRATRMMAALGEWIEVRGPQRVSPAAALAKAGLAREALAVDFAHDKLAADSHSGQSRRRVAMLAGLIVLLLLGLGAGEWYRAATRVSTLEAEYAAIRDEAQALQSMRDRILTAEPWFAPQPIHLACLRDLTRAFPEEGRIWVDHFRLRTGDTGAIQCRAESRRTMLDLLEHMERSPRFDEVQLRDWQETDRDTAAVRFELTFRHLPDATPLQETGG